ncbi:MAG: hypothetical protein ACE5E2_06540 [Candidatus Binatia bacterium]
MNRERWLLLISVFIFVGLGIYYLRSAAVATLFRKISPSGAAKLLARRPILEGTTAQGLPEITGPDRVVDERTPWGRNPFLTEEEEAKVTEPEPEVEELKIKAIIVGPPRSVATLDGRAVLVGEMIGGETVLDIRQDAVVLEKGGRKRVLRIREPSISIQIKDGKN